MCAKLSVRIPPLACSSLSPTLSSCPLHLVGDPQLEVEVLRGEEELGGALAEVFGRRGELLRARLRGAEPLVHVELLLGRAERAVEFDEEAGEGAGELEPLGLALARLQNAVVLRARTLEERANTLPWGL